MASKSGQPDEAGVVGRTEDDAHDLRIGAVQRQLEEIGDILAGDIRRQARQAGDERDGVVAAYQNPIP